VTANGNGRSGGKGKPPKEHQWPKGQSGNPRGRPKKAVGGLSDPDVGEIILAEGSKTITLTEGGKPCTMPAIQAATRAMLVSAIKGNSHAQRSFVQMVANAQTQQQKRQEEEIVTALALKIQLEALRNQWLAKGRHEMDMPLHPADIERSWYARGQKLPLAYWGGSRSTIQAGRVPRLSAGSDSTFIGCCSRRGR
jgi:hypothetical protein